LEFDDPVEDDSKEMRALPVAEDDEAELSRIPRRLQDDRTRAIAAAAAIMTQLRVLIVFIPISGSTLIDSS
jgi:hypothetical protein